MSDEAMPAKCPMCGADVGEADVHCSKCGVPLIDLPDELGSAERWVDRRPPRERKSPRWSWDMERTVLTCAAALNAVAWLVLAAAGVVVTLTRLPGEKINPLLNPFVAIMAGTLGVAQIHIFSRLNRYYATRTPPGDEDEME